jgi:hypothetical protein
MPVDGKEANTAFIDQMNARMDNRTWLRNRKNQFNGDWACNIVIELNLFVLIEDTHRPEARDLIAWSSGRFPKMGSRLVSLALEVVAQHRLVITLQGDSPLPQQDSAGAEHGDGLQVM